MPAARTMVAVTHFSYAAGDREVHVHAGDRFTSTHPVVKRYSEWFVVEGHDIEQATAAPGEKRTTRRRKQA
jgi:hypothetical protein